MSTVLSAVFMIVMIAGEIGVMLQRALKIIFDRVLNAAGSACYQFYTEGGECVLRTLTDTAAD